MFRSAVTSSQSRLKLFLESAGSCADQQLAVAKLFPHGRHGNMFSSSSIIVLGLEHICLDALLAFAYCYLCE